MGNILAKFDGELSSSFDIALATDDAEKLLAEKYSEIEGKLESLYKANDYKTALSELSALKEPVDSFFDSVLVMADDEKVKINRLSLLNNIRNSFYNIADISLLQ